MKVMVFDVGGTGIKYSVIDEQLNRTDTGSTPTPADSQEHFLNTLREIYLPHKDEVDGIALSLPGFIDAELMAEDEQLMSMQDWLKETDRFLTNNRRQVLDGKGHISREAAVKKVSSIYEEFRKRQDADYISEFDRQTEKYLKGE